MMDNPVVFEPLSAFGWDDRARAAYGEVAGPTHVPGRVVRVDRVSCVVVTAEGERIATVSDLPAVGDWVALDERDDADAAGQLVIVAVAPRWSALTRHDAD